jgi:hypothetical protein
VVISVRSISKTFHRAGKKFTETPQEIEVDKKTYDILKAEPMLVVEEVKEEKKKDK